MSRITINGISLDPAASNPTVAALSAGDAAKSNYILMQTKQPLSESEKQTLQSTGVGILEYVSANTYLCAYKPTDLTPIRSLPFVSWAGVYHRDFKLAPSLRPAPATAVQSIGGLEAAAPTRRTLHTVDIVLHDDVPSNDSAVRQRIADAVHMSPDDLKMDRHKVRLNVQERYLADLAALDEVRHVEEVPQVKLFNSVARDILKAQVVINGTSFQGDDQIVVVNDTGFDQGSTANVHPAFAGRVLKLTPLGRPGKADDPDGHGTHVAGSVLGDGNSPTMGGAIQGTAPKARLIFQSLLDSDGGLGGIPSDLHDLFGPPYETDHARIQTNSWGATTPGLPYDQSSREIDDFVWNNQDCVICFAAGNDGIDANSDGVVDNASIGSEAAAKNCITVGASESDRPAISVTYGALRPSFWPRAPIFGDKIANNDEGMAAFSSRGPTKESRFKPDVVAPGTSILSTRSRNLASPTVLFGTSSDPAYFFDAGTSMATPLVAGCVAVVRESLVKNGTTAPSAALIKALLINGAVPLTGQYHPSEAGTSFNTSSGWGRVDLAGSIIVPGPSANGGFTEGKPLRQAEESTITIDIPPGHGPGSANEGVGPTALGATFKITLVWSDPPGATLQNDLDLVVKAANGDERHGNMGTSREFDRINNVEQVLWVNMPPGKATITVRAFHITNFAQPWAYAWRLS
jgi:hypothetical protein